MYILLIISVLRIDVDAILEKGVYTMTPGGRYEKYPYPSNR